VLLATVAMRLTDCIRASDTVARLGGDEFAVLLERNGGPGEAGLVAERVIAALTAPVRLGDHEVVVGASVGTAVEDGRLRTAAALMRAADAALYWAKRAAPGTAARFDPRQTEEAEAHAESEADGARTSASSGVERRGCQPPTAARAGARVGGRGSAAGSETT
jgi:GGDEF domain-containing protein